MLKYGFLLNTMYGIQLIIIKTGVRYKTKDCVKIKSLVLSLLIRKAIKAYFLFVNSAEEKRKKKRS